MRACGIDFGTSNSTVALPSGEVLAIDPLADSPRLFRSVLFFPEGERSVHAGARAIAEYLEHSEGRFIQSAKAWLPSSAFTGTQIRNRPMRLEDIIATLLRRIREAAESVSGAPLVSAVLGRPAVFSPDPASEALAQRRLEEAARLAGFEDVTFLIEPIAAALTYEANLDHDELVLTGDFGAGTSDFTLMRLGPGRATRDRRADIVGSGGVSVGGDRFDAAIMKHALLRYFGEGSSYDVGGKRLAIPPHVLGKLLSWHEMSLIRERGTQELIDKMLRGGDDIPAIEALQDLVLDNLGYRLFREIERAKIALSASPRADLRFHEARIAIDVTIGRDDFDRWTAPLRAELEATVDELFERTGARAEDIDAVFLTGGTSHIPAVHAIFAARFGHARLRTADAFTSVAEGLGRAAGAEG